MRPSGRAGRVPLFPRHHPATGCLYLTFASQTLNDLVDHFTDRERGGRSEEIHCRRRVS